MGVDVGEAGLDLSDPVGVGCRFSLGEEGVPLGVGGKHDIDQGLLARGSLLRHLADAGVLRQADRAGLRRDLARIRRNKVVLPLPFRPTRPVFAPS